MAKGAATEGKLGKLHARLATVFTKILDDYEKRLDADPSDLDEDSLADAMLEHFEPSPAMLSAIAKFLKDNDIGMDSEEVEKLSGTQRRLEEMKKRRGENVVSLTNLDPVAADG